MGKDAPRGGTGADVFVFNEMSESGLGWLSDHIKDFDSRSVLDGVLALNLDDFIL